MSKNIHLFWKISINKHFKNLYFSAEKSFLSLQKEFANIEISPNSYFFLKGSQKFLTPDLKSTVKSSPVKRGQIPKNVKLSRSNSKLKTLEQNKQVVEQVRREPHAREDKNT